MSTFQALLEYYLHHVDVNVQTQFEGSSQNVDMGSGVGGIFGPSSTLNTVYEPAVTKALTVLDRLTDVFTAGDDTGSGTGDETNWVAEIERVRALGTAPPGKVVIGLIGPSGAGKSSLINAVVDESVLPTTTTTDVVTEVAYNHTSDAKYRSEVEILSPAEWEAEVRAWVKDIGSGDPESVVTAVDKLRAVYPALSTDEIQIPPSKISCVMTALPVSWARPRCSRTTTTTTMSASRAARLRTLVVPPLKSTSRVKPP